MYWLDNGGVDESNDEYNSNDRCKECDEK